MDQLMISWYQYRKKQVWLLKFVWYFITFLHHAWQVLPHFWTWDYGNAHASKIWRGTVVCIQNSDVADGHIQILRMGGYLLAMRSSQFWQSWWTTGVRWHSDQLDHSDIRQSTEIQQLRKVSFDHLGSFPQSISQLQSRTDTCPTGKRFLSSLTPRYSRKTILSMLWHGSQKLKKHYINIFLFLLIRFQIPYFQLEKQGWQQNIGVRLPKLPSSWSSRTLGTGSPLAH